MAAGGLGYHVVWAYSSLCMAIFLVRTMKRVIFQEALHYSESFVLCVWVRAVRCGWLSWTDGCWLRGAGHQATRHNYLLLGLAVMQFPFTAWLARVPM